jgi:hypothetical protein
VLWSIPEVADVKRDHLHVPREILSGYFGWRMADLNIEQERQGVEI